MVFIFVSHGTVEIERPSSLSRLLALRQGEVDKNQASMDESMAMRKKQARHLEMTFAPL